MESFKCEHCKQEFEVNTEQNEESIERQYFGMYGFFPDEVPAEDVYDVCEFCYEDYLRWHFSLPVERREEIITRLADSYGVDRR